jgi:hypothetical protein
MDDDGQIAARKVLVDRVKLAAKAGDDDPLADGKKAHIDVRLRVDEDPRFAGTVLDETLAAVSVTNGRASGGGSDSGSDSGSGGGAAAGGLLLLRWLGIDVLLMPA